MSSNEPTILVVGGSPEGALTLKGGMGMCASKTPFSRLSRSSQGSHLKQQSLKISSQGPLLSKI